MGDSEERTTWWNRLCAGAKRFGIGQALTLAVVWICAVGVALALPRYFAPVGVTENWVTDLITTFATPQEPQNQDVILLTITEDTLAQFPYRSPLDRSYIANLLRTLEKVGVRAVGFDILFDQPTEPSKDEDLARAFREVKIPVASARGGKEAGLTDAQLAFLSQYAAPILPGAANLERDDRDGAVRKIHPPVNGIPSLPGALAQALGRKIPETAVSILYRRGPNAETSAFASFPSHLVESLPPEWLNGKVALVGLDLPQDDRHRTPFAAAFGGREGTIPGVTIHAHALAQMLDGRSRPEWSATEEAISAGFMAGVGILLALSSLPGWIGALVGATALSAPWIGGYFLVVSGGPVAPPLTPTLVMIMTLAISSNVVGRRLRDEKRFVESAFGRYVSPAILAELQEDPSRLRLGGERRELTYVFTDIAGFTTLSESLAPDVIAELLNRYLDGMSAIVLDHQGTIDKYIGDAVVAVFGAPVARSDDADRAVACAVELDRFAARFRTENTEYGFGLTRIGVNSGGAVVGNFGGSARFDYTAIGDTVNTAARLEGVNKYLGTRIAIGHRTVELCRRHSFRPIAEIVLKGKTTAIPVFSPVTDVDDPDLIKAYYHAYARLKDGDPEAPALFAALAERWPNDAPVMLHQRRLNKAGSASIGVSLVMEDK
ncbi:adenylate cyclase [Azospirillaceae bacterium]